MRQETARAFIYDYSLVNIHTRHVCRALLTERRGPEGGADELVFCFLPLNFFLAFMFLLRLAIVLDDSLILFHGFFVFPRLLRLLEKHYRFFSFSVLVQLLLLQYLLPHLRDPLCAQVVVRHGMRAEYPAVG